jgi:RNA polymerase sigma-70 factor, ECF subfamily
VTRATDSKGLHTLMDRYCDGDPRAFQELHAVLCRSLRGFLFKLVRDESTADDLLQLTFLKAHLARERFFVQGRDADNAVLGWYYAIARNVALDHLRQRERRARRTVDLVRDDGSELELADTGATIEETAIQGERGEAVITRVREAIAQLPKGQREVVELHKLQGMSMAEVAERLDIREGAARVRAHRGYKALARLLGVGASTLISVHLAQLTLQLGEHHTIVAVIAGLFEGVSG